MYIIIIITTFNIWKNKNKNLSFNKQETTMYLHFVCNRFKSLKVLIIIIIICYRIYTNIATNNFKYNSYLFIIMMIYEIIISTLHDFYVVFCVVVFVKTLVLNGSITMHQIYTYLHIAKKINRAAGNMHNA